MRAALNVCSHIVNFIPDANPLVAILKQFAVSSAAATLALLAYDGLRRTFKRVRRNWRDWK